jgi:hypothetical protein
MVMSKSVERRLKVQKGCTCDECENVLPDESDIIMSNLVEKMLMEAIEKYHLINDEGDVKADTKKLPELMRKYGLKKYENDMIMKPLNKPTEEIETEMVDAFEQGVLPLVDHLKE